MENQQLELLEKPAKVNVFIPLMRTTQVTENRNREDEIITMKVRPKMDYNLTHYNVDENSLSADQVSRKFHTALTKALNAFHEVMKQEMGNPDATSVPPPKPVASNPRISKNP